MEVKLERINLENLGKYNHSIPERIINPIEGGNECFIFVNNKKIVHLSRIRYDKLYMPEVNLNILLNEKEACIFDCYTDEDYRGLGLYPAMLSEILNYLKQKDFTKSYIYCDSKNEKSIRGIKKAGFREYKIISYLNILGFRKKEEKQIENEN
jgi:RimJ/RimL family protein N-acetyltransferase